MYLLPIYLCFCSFFVSFLLGHKLSNFGSVFLNLLCLFFSLLFSFFIFYEVCMLHINCYVNLTPWIHLDSVLIHWSFLFDPLSSCMLIVILFVSLCANFYSVEYMTFDPHKIRFFSYLSLFTFTMILLVTANTLVQLFFGWECVGISSYLLINFWYTRIQANKSSILAIMANKTGDIFLLFSCLFLLCLYNNLYFYIFFLCHDYYINYISNIYSSILHYYTTGYFLFDNFNIRYVLLEKEIININDYLNGSFFIFISIFICFFIILASICKSAQSGFHFWLAEAMEGPTPVSSLLHAATMVTAGIFLTLRCSFLFNYSYDIPLFIIFVGALTSFFSSLIGITQSDLKKIVAYSTCSQLGYMFLSNGIFSYNYTMFHLFNHAFFKALLFLTSGYIIHILSNEQDIRRMGGLIKIIPLPYICLFIGSISLMGIPYLSGFFSKDTIIENFFSIFISYDLNLKYYSIIFFSQLLLSISVTFTILYSVKLIYYVFINSFNGFFSYLNNIHFSSIFILTPLILLSLLSIFSGYFFSDYMIGTGTFFWNNSINFFFSDYDKLISSNYDNIISLFFILLPYEFNQFTYYYIFLNSIYITSFSFFFFYNHSYFIYFYTLGIIKVINISYIHLSKKVLFFNRLIINLVLYFFFFESYQSTYKLLDKNIFEVLGPFGIIFNLKLLLNNINFFSTGLIYHYSGIMLNVLMIFFFYNCFYY